MSEWQSQILRDAYGFKNFESSEQGEVRWVQKDWHCFSCLFCVMTLLISDLDINSMLFCLRDVLV